MSLWKTSKIYICKTPGMSLWLGLNCVRFALQDRRATKKEEAIIISKFPHEVTDCRCRNCRYFRLVKS